MRKRLQRLITLVLLFAPAGATADEVRLKGKPTFRAVRVLGVREQQITFEGISGQLLRKPLTEIACVQLSGHPLFNAAERAAAAGDLAAAADAYQRARTEGDEMWFGTLLAWRELAVVDRPATFDAACRTYAALLAGSSEPPPTPNHPGVPGAPQNAAAIAALEVALAEATATGTIAAIRTPLLQLYILEDVTDKLAAIDRRPPPPATQPPPATSRLGLGLIPTEDTTAPSPVPEPNTPVPWPQLPPDTFLLPALDTLLDAGDAAHAARIVDAAWEHVADDDLPAWRLRRARLWLLQGLADTATDELHDLVTSGPPALRPAGLYYEGLALDAAGNRPAAIRSLERILALPDGPADWQARAGATLEHWQGRPTSQAAH